MTLHCPLWPVEDLRAIHGAFFIPDLENFLPYACSSY